MRSHRLSCLPAPHLRTRRVRRGMPWQAGERSRQPQCWRLDHANRGGVGPSSWTSIISDCWMICSDSISSSPWLTSRHSVMT